MTAGSQRHGSGDPDPLPLTARELVRVAVAVLGVEPDELEQLDHPRPRVLAGLAVDDHRLGDDVVDRHLRIQGGVGILEDDLQLTTDRAHLLVRQRRELTPAELHRPGRGLVQLEHRAAGGRLPAPGLADQAERLT